MATLGAVKVARMVAVAGSLFLMLASASGQTTAPETSIPTPSAKSKLTATIYVSNGESITAYAPGSNGNVPPIVSISDRDSMLESPWGIALDSKGNIYVANYDGGANSAGTVTVYAAASDGDTTPIATIEGPRTNLNKPFGIALDANGRIYIANFMRGIGTGSVTVYPAGSNGDVPPLATIAGHDTSLDNPSSIAVDSSGKIYVGNRGSGNSASSISVYSPRADGNVKPLATISGPHTGLYDPCIAVDAAGTIYAGNSNDSVTMYPAGSSGDAKPLAKVAGPRIGDKTELSQPNGIALDSKGNLYVANATDADSIVNVYKTSSKGNVSPIEVLRSTNQGAESVAVDQNGRVYLTSQSRENAYYGDSSGMITVFSPVGGGEAKTVASIFTSGQTNLRAGGIAVGSKGDVYLSIDSHGSDNGSIDVFAAGRYGNVAPISVISGPKSGVHFPSGVAVDPSGRIYASNWFGNLSSYTVYSPGSNGDVTPIASVIGPDTRMADARAIGLAYDGNVYIGDYHCGDDKILIYRHDSDGNVKPMATVNGGVPGIYSPVGVAVDSSGRLYVTTKSIKYTSPTALPWPGHDEQYYCVSKQTRDGRTLSFALPGAKHHMTGTKSGGAILVYSPDDDATPVAVITGPHTGLDEPRGIAVDSGGYIYVENDGSPSDDKGGSVTIYSPTSNSDAAPVSAISGPMTGIHFPHGIALGPPIEMRQ